MTTLNQLRDDVFQAIIDKYLTVDTDARLDFLMQGMEAPDMPTKANEAMGLLVFIFKTNPKMKEHENVFDEIFRSIVQLSNQDEETYRRLLTLLK